MTLKEGSSSPLIALTTQSAVPRAIATQDAGGGDDDDDDQPSALQAAEEGSGGGRHDDGSGPTGNFRPA